MIFKYGTITLYGAPFQEASSKQTLSKYSPSKAFIYIMNATDTIILQPPPRAPREKILNSEFETISIDQNSKLF